MVSVHHAVRHRAQQKKYDCGPTSLAMLLEFYDVAHETEALEELCNTSEKSGTHHDDLVEAAKSLGVNVCVHADSSIEDLRGVLTRGHPVIVNYFNPITRVGHFAVVKGIDHEMVTLADPKNGDGYRLSFADFDSHWHNMDKTLWRWMMHFT
jgi:ABC-type bacteriocin/lantibiotic exporter with double-glycine peptidase domain